MNELKTIRINKRMTQQEAAARLGVSLRSYVSYENDETKKNYIVYTDNEKDKEGNTQVYASIYNPEDPESRLEAITTDKEWKVIETILNTLQEEAKNSKDDNGNDEQ